MNISFDFDGTLDQDEMQVLAKRFMEAGHNLWIVTSRPSNPRGWKGGHTDLVKVARDLGIPNNIKYCDYDYKFSHLDGFDLHFDNDAKEVEYINSHPGKCMAFLYTAKPKNKNIE